ncbi:hypothetical protein Tco_0056816, partial [Tanacetum coccineum]
YPSSSATCLFSNTPTSNSVGFIVFGKLPAINGFGIPLPVAVCSGITNSSLLIFREVKDDDTIDHMETENAQSEGRTKNIVDEDKEIDEVRLSTEDVVSTDKEGVSTDFEKVSTDRPIVSTDGSKVSTDEQVEGTEEHNEGTEEIFEGTEEQREGTEEIFEGTEEQKEGTEEKVESTAAKIKGTEDQTKEETATKASQTSTQTPTSIIFGDDETIATLFLNMSQAKAASKE